MAIRPEADRYFGDNDEERILAQHLHEAFDVTHRQSHGDLAFWLAEPHQHMKQRIGFRKEVLVIYSPHRKTDARVLTAIENITRHPDFKHRVDQVVFLLIHKGDMNETTELVKSQPDRIIIPIHVDELLDPHRGSLFLRSRIVGLVGEIDLFGMSSPITSDEYFFGRDELVQQIITGSVIHRGCSGLFGLRKTGKTSVLRAIQRRIADRPILAEYVDCSNPGIHAARWWQVLESLVTKCSDTLLRERKRTVKAGIGYTPTNAGVKFTSDIQSMLRYGNLDNLILMLDEVEYITHGLAGALGQHWDDDFVPFWQSIRATHQESEGRFSFLVAGVNPACVEVSHFGTVSNPVFQLAVPHYLEPFPVSAVRDMVRSIGRYAGLKFEEGVYAYLQERYGGHPFLIRIACSEVWKQSDVQDPYARAYVTVDDFENSSMEIRARLSQPIKDILLSLVWWYPDEYDLLRILAEGDTSFVDVYTQRDPSTILKFSGYGILKRGNLKEFAIADLREFLNQHGEEYQEEISPFIRGDMPPELLPEVPDINVLGELFVRRSKIEVKLRQAIMLYLGVKLSWDEGKIAKAIADALSPKFGRKNPADMFVGRAPRSVMNELYTSDLKAIITHHWSVFSPLFDNKKGRFEMNMDTLNIARRVDAHTKPVTEVEIIEFNNSYTWLLSRLSKVPVSEI